MAITVASNTAGALVDPLNYWWYGLPQICSGTIQSSPKPMNAPLAKRLIDADLKTFIEAGFLNSDLSLTGKGTQELLAVLFMEKKAELLKIAQDQLKESDDLDCEKSAL